MRKGKTTRKATKRAKSTGKKKPPQTLQEAKERIRNLVQTNSEVIAEAVMDEACKGKYLPAKFLFETVGLCEAQPEAEQAPENKESLEHLLLEQWQLKPAPPDDDGNGSAEEEPVTIG